MNFWSEFDGTSHWSVRAWISLLTKRGRENKRFQYCLSPNSSEHFLYFQEILGHSRDTFVDLSLQDNVLLPDDFALHSRETRCTPIRTKKKSNTTWISQELRWTRALEIIHQNTVYWCNLKLAQRKGLQFYQTRSNAIVLFNTLLAICIEKNYTAK